MQLSSTITNALFARNGAENRWEKLNHDLYADAEIVEMS